MANEHSQRPPTKCVDVFESTLQKTNVWLKDLERRLRTDDRPRAYAALRSVLHALRDCLPVDETAKLSSQMPLLMRGIYFDGWKPRRKPLRHTRTSFLAAIRECLRSQSGLDPALAARAVLAMLESHLSEGEVAHVRRVLPAELREFWSEADKAAASGPRETQETREVPEASPAVPQWQPGWAARQAGARAGGVTDLPYWTR